jgi:hypothetical protein
MKVTIEGQDILHNNEINSLHSFIGNKEQIDLLHDFFKSEEKAIIIVGPSGSGKTTLVHLLFSHYKILNVARPCYENFVSHKDFEAHIVNFLETRSLTSLSNYSRKGLFFDDVDVLLSQDRYVNSFINDLLNVKSDHLLQNTKVVFTCSASEEKKLTDLKKKLRLIKLENPRPEDACKYISELLTLENIHVEQNDIMNISQSMNGNIRNIMLNMNFCGMDTHQSDARTYFDLNIFSTVFQIFQNSSKGFKDLDVALSCDPTLISYIIYDNYKLIFNKMYSLDQNFQTHDVPYINKMYLDSCLIEDHAYKLNDWSLIEQANLIRCGCVRVVQCKLKPKSCNKAKIDLSHISYTQVTTRAAQYYNNLKRISAYLDDNRLLRSNQLMMADVMFERQKCINAKPAKDSKSELGFMRALYQNNICSNTSRVYAPKITFQTN